MSASGAKRHRRIVVVGGIAAGPAAAARARRIDPAAEITLFESGETVSYGICEVPYVVGGSVPDETNLVIYSPERLAEEKRITVKTLHHVERIDPRRQQLKVRDLPRRKVNTVDYDRLVLATGASPVKLNVKGEDAGNVFHVRSRSDTLGILNALTVECPKQAVIIGGGYVGLEMAEALGRRGLEVTVVHRTGLPLHGVERPAREELLKVLADRKIEFVGEAKVEAILAKKRGIVTHVLTTKGAYEAQLVIVAAGAKPNVELARSAGIRLGSFGGIQTDPRQMTSVDRIFAAGDCCEVKNAVTGKPMYIPLATIAARSGSVAGENAAGGKARFGGAIRALALKFFDLEIAQVGLDAATAKRYGFDVAVESITSYDRIRFMPGSELVTVILVAERRTGRLLGATVFGSAGAVLRANTLGVAVQRAMTLEDVSRFDLIYAPPFAPLRDPIHIASSQTQKHLRKG